VQPIRTIGHVEIRNHDCELGIAAQKANSRITIAGGRHLETLGNEGLGNDGAKIVFIFYKQYMDWHFITLVRGSKG